LLNRRQSRSDRFALVGLEVGDGAAETPEAFANSSRFMPNSERGEMAVARAKEKNGTREGLRLSVLDTKGEVEIPLRDALRMVRVLSLIETPENEDDAKSVAYLAREAVFKLEVVADELRGLLRACIMDF